MSYIGAKELKASDIRRFDVTGSTSATHTLTWSAPTEQSLIVTINGVKQQEDAYSVSGTTLTLTSALVSTDKLEVIGINDIGTTITPAQNSVTADTIADGVITNAKINASAAIAKTKLASLDIVNADVNASAAIALSKLATDPSNASNLASGTVPTARLGSGTANSGVFLRGDSSWSAIGTPYFEAGMDTTQTLTDSTWTKVVFDDEYYDSDSAFNPSTGVFTIPSGEGGTYLFYTSCCLYGSGALLYSMIYFYVNGGSRGDYMLDQYSPSSASISNMGKSQIIECSAGDEITVYARITQHNSAGAAQVLPGRTSFGGFKLG